MESVKSRIEEKIKGNEAFGESWTGFLKANAEYVEYCHKQGKKPKDVLPYVTNLLENAARRDKSGLPNPLEQKPGFFKRTFSKKDKEEEKKLETLRQELQKVQSVALKNPDIVKDCLSAVEKGKSIPAEMAKSVFAKAKEYASDKENAANDIRRKKAYLGEQVHKLIELRKTGHEQSSQKSAGKPRQMSQSVAMTHKNLSR